MKNKEKELNDYPKGKKISSKKVKDRKGIMGTDADLAYISDTLFDDDLRK